MRAPQKGDRAFGRQGLLLEIVMMKTNHSARAKELRQKCWLCLSSTLGCGRKQRHWLARVILYGAFFPKFTTTLARLFEDPLLLVSFGIVISFNHYAHKKDITRQHTCPRPCKLNTFVLLVNQQCCFAVDVWFVAPMRYLFLQSSLAWTRRWVRLSIE